MKYGYLFKTLVKSLVKGSFQVRGDANITAFHDYKEPVINVCVPYEPGYKLGAAYNRIMAESRREWVLFLDHDVHLVNPNWYDMCQKAIHNLGDDAKSTGWISAVTNFSISGTQFSPGCPKSSDICDHIMWAKQQSDTHGVKAVEAGGLMTGFFILTSKTAWEAVGGFIDGYLVDQVYSKHLYCHGYKVFVLPGLYVYHGALEGKGHNLNIPILAKLSNFDFRKAFSKIQRRS